MKNATINNISTFLLPISLLLAAFWLMPRISSLPPVKQELIGLAPYASIGVGMFLSIHFHRGRMFFVLLNVAIFYWCCRTFLAEGPTGLSGQIVLQSLCLILPFNFTMFSLMRERGIITVAGRLRFAFLAMQGMGIVWLVRGGAGQIQLFMGREFIQSGKLAAIGLPQTAIPVFLLAFLIIGLKAALKKSPMDSGILGALAAMAVACARVGDSQVNGLFIAAAATTIALSVLQDSYNMAFRDDLTTLPSRRALNEQLNWLGRKYAVAMLDVDHFKKFNDTYGHDVGDQVLRMVAAKMRHVGGGGKAFRYGGEEFTILFPGKTLEEALPHLERLRRTIADYQMLLRGSERPKNCNEGKRLRGGSQSNGSVSVTISIGVAEYGEKQKKPAEVIKAADKALYRAKGKGRNQVAV